MGKQKFTKSSARSFVFTFLILFSIVSFHSIGFAQAIGDYRSASATMNWNATTSWERWNGSAWILNPTEGYPGFNPGAGIVTIRDGHTVTLMISPGNPIGGLRVGEGVSGTLIYDQTNRTLNVGANGVIVNTGALYTTANPANPTPNTHTLNVSGNFTNNGTINFEQTDASITDVVNLNLSGNLSGSGTHRFNNVTFNGTANQSITISGSVSRVGTVVFNNTGTAPNNQIQNTSVSFSDQLNATTFTAGRYVFNNSGTHAVTNTGNVQLNGMVVEVLQGTMTFGPNPTGYLNLSTGAAVTTSTGALIVNGSTAQVTIGGSETGNTERLRTNGGSVTVQNGGVLVIGNDIFGDLDMGAGAFGGTLTVDGSGSRLDAGRLITGANNAVISTVTLSNNALVRLSRLRTALIPGSLIVFFFRGQATLNINSGADLIVGNPDDSVGNFSSDQNNSNPRVMNLSGSGSSLVIHGRWLGAAGAGPINNVTYNVSNNATVDVASNLLAVSAAGETSNMGMSTLNVSSGAVVNFYNQLESVSNNNLVFIGNINGGGLNVDNATVNVINGPSIENILFTGGNAAFNVGGTSTLTNGAVVNVGTQAVLVTTSDPPQRNFFDIVADGALTVSNSTINVGGGNRGNMRTQGAGSSLTMNSGTINVRGRFEVTGNGSGMFFNGGVANVGLQPISAIGGNGIIFNANPSIITSFVVTGTAVVNMGDGNAECLVGNNNNDPVFINENGSAGHRFEISGDGVFNLNGRFSLQDAQARFIMSGNGRFNINPSSEQDLPGTVSVFLLQRGIINVSGTPVVTILNPPGNAGPGNSLNINVLSTTNLNAALSGIPAGSPGDRVPTPVDFSALTIRLGDGVANQPGSSEGFQVNISADHAYGNFEFNNPTGVNRFVDWISRNTNPDPVTGVNRPYLVGNFTLTAGEVRLRANRINSRAAGSNTLLLGTGSRLVMTNRNNLNHFPGDSSAFATYTINTNSTVVYGATTGTGNQQIGRLTAPSVFSNIEISGTVGNKTIVQPITVNGTLFLENSTLVAGSNLELGTEATLSRNLGVMTGNVSNVTSYRIRYTGNSKSTNASEWTGTGTKDLILSLNTGQTLSLATNYNVDSLVINPGSILNVSSFQLGVSSHIVNSGIQEGAGSIVLNQSLTHNLSGINGRYENVQINGPVSDSVTVFLLSNATINGQLIFQNVAQDRILHINGTSRLTLATTGIILNATGTGGVFRMITTDGTTNAIGLRKQFSTVPSSFTFPIGVLGIEKFTPATIDISSAASLGALTIKPVNELNPVTTDSVALNFYWSISDSGLASPTATLTFNYAQSDVPSFSTETAFIPARYAPVAWTRINDVTQVDDVNNVITFSNVNYLRGDFTAGEPSAFAAVLTYFTRASGNWTDPNTWSVVSINGPVAGTLPNSRRPVFIGGNHTVTANISNLLSASLDIDAGSTLELANGTVNHNFGVTTGSGTIRLVSNSATPPPFPGGSYTAFLASGGGTVDYSGTGSYTIPNSITEFNNLAASGSGVKTLPDVTLTLAGNLIAGGSATLEFSSASLSDVAVSGNIITQSGATIRFSSAGSARTITAGGLTNDGTFNLNGTSAVSHILELAGTLNSNGTVNFINGAHVVNTRFVGTAQDSIRGTGSITLNRLIVNKGTSQLPTLVVTAPSFLVNGSTLGLDKPFDLINGTLRLSGTTPFTQQLSTDNNNFTIPATARLYLDNPNATINIGVAAGAANLILVGGLQIDAGILNVGTDLLGATENTLRYQGTTSASITINGGELNVVSNLEADGVGNFLNYTQTGGVVRVQRARQTIANNTFGQATSAAFLMSGGGSFTMSGGILEVVGSHSNPAVVGYNGFRINTVSVFNVTGGTVRIGTSAMNLNGRNKNIAIVSSVPFWNLELGFGTLFTGNIGQPQATSIATLTVLNDLTVNLAGQFRGYRVTSVPGDNQLANLNIGGNFTIINGSYVVPTGGNTVEFNGSGLPGQSNPQIISTNNTTYRTIRIFNTSGGVELAPSTSITINRRLNVATGSFNGNIVGSTVSFVSSTVPDDVDMDILGTSSFYNLVINRTTPNDSVFTNGSITVGNQLNLVNGVLSLRNNLLSIDNTADNAITGGGPYGPNRAIRTSGLGSAVGIRRSFPNATTVGYLYPLVTSDNIYRPVTVSVTTAGGLGQVTVSPIASRHPSAPAATSLNYNWKISAENFTGAEVEYELQYVDLATNQDVPTVGGDTGYEVGVFNGLIWDVSPTGVNPTLNTITLSRTGNFVNNYFTAGFDFVNPVIYYTWRGTSSPNTWSIPTADPNTSPWSADPLTFTPISPLDEPGTSNPVIIQNTHTAIISGVDQKFASSVVIEPTARLEIQNTIAHDFGLGVSGSGTLTLNTTVTPVIPALQSQFLTVGGGTVEFSGGTYTLPTTPNNYNNVIISGTGIKTINGFAYSVNSNLTVRNGATLSMADVLGSTIDRSTSGGGVFTLENNANLTVSGIGNYPRNYLTNTLEDGSTVTFDRNLASGNQNIAPFNNTNGGGYSNLILSRQTNPAGNAVVNKRLIGETVIRGNLTLNLDAVLRTQNNDFTVGGNITLNGTAGDSSFIDIGTSTLTLNGSGTQVLTRVQQNTGGLLLRNVVKEGSGTVQLNSTTNTWMSVDSLFINSGSFSVNTRRLVVYGNVNNNATFTTAGSVAFANSTTNQLLNSTTPLSFDTLIVNKNSSTSVIVNTPITITSNLSMPSDGFIAPSGSLNSISFGNSATTTGAFSGTRKILLSGTLGASRVIKNGTLPSHFNGFVLPIGVGADYNQFILNATAIDPSVTGVAVSILLPNTGNSSVFVPARALTQSFFTEVLGSGNFTGFHRYIYSNSAVQGTEVNYVSRYHNGTNWVTPANPVFNAAADSGGHRTAEVFASGINYEWLVGEISAFSPPLFSRNATLGGDWDDFDTWTTDPTGAGGPAGTIPNAVTDVSILAGHTVFTTANGQSAGSIIINRTVTPAAIGVLDIAQNNTFGHVLGSINGQGDLRLRAVFPTFTVAGSDFFDIINGGLVDYTSTDSYNIPASPAVYNDLRISGGGSSTKTLTSNITVTDLFIQPATTLDANATGNHTITMRDDYLNNGTFVPREGIFEASAIVGTQNFNGTLNFYDIILDGSTVKNFNSAVDVGRNFRINNTSGPVNMFANNLTVGGNFTNEATPTTFSQTGAGLTTFNRSTTGDQEITGITSFANVTAGLSDGTLILNDSIYVAGTLTLNSPLDVNNEAIGIGGDLTLSGALSNAQNVEFNGSSITQVINGDDNFQTVNFTVNGSSNAVFIEGGNFDITGDLRVLSGTLASDITLNLPDIDSVIIGSSGVFNPDNFAQIELTGNWRNNGLFNLSAATTEVTFKGTSPALITGTSVTTFYDLVIQKDGADVEMQRNVTVTNQLTLNSGILIAGSNTVRLTDSDNGNDVTGTPISVSAGSFVEGNLQIDYPNAANATRRFPLGSRAMTANGYDYLLAELPVELTINHLSGSNSIRMAMINTNAPVGSPAFTLQDGLEKVSSMRYYSVSNPGGGTYDGGVVTLPWNSDDFVVANPLQFDDQSLNLRVARLDIGNSEWTSLGNTSITGDANGGTITSTVGFSNANAFALGTISIADNPLPVELSEFVAVPKDNGSVMLQWRTRSEFENLGFIVLRSESQEGAFKEIASFRNVETLRGLGTNSTGQEYTFVDNARLQPGRTYYYKLKDVSFSGAVIEHTPVMVRLADAYSLSQNYPNPFNPSTTIEFSLKQEGRATLEVFNLLGQKVAILVDGNLKAGAHRYNFNGINLSSGVYFYQLRSGDFKAVKKMMLVK